MKQTTRINGDCWCPRCQQHYDYKEMADENTCQECVSHYREVLKVDFKKLLESMPDEDITEEMKAYDKKKMEEFAEEEMIEDIELRDKLINGIEKWNNSPALDTKFEDHVELADRIIKLIK